MIYIIEFNKLSKDNNCITIANIYYYLYIFIYYRMFNFK